jgi:hypothetical protein
MCRSEIWVIKMGREAKTGLRRDGAVGRCGMGILVTDLRDRPAVSVQGRFARRCLVAAFGAM